MFKTTLSYEEFEEWINDLENGKFEQVYGCLTRDAGEGKKGYCCLGVLAQKHMQVFKNADSPSGYSYKPYIEDSSRFMSTYLNDNKGKTYLIDGNLQDILSNLNDSGDYDFKKIAKFLRTMIKRDSIDYKCTEEEIQNKK